MAQIGPSPIVQRLRTKSLNRQTAAKFVWLYLTTHYDLTQPQVIKIRYMADTIGLMSHTMRHAIKLLVQHRYLRVITPPTHRQPGTYVAGERAYVRGTAPV